MDINDIRSFFTILGLLCFVAICFWAYSKHARAGFEEAAQLPFSDDDAPVPATGRHRKEG